MCGQSSSDFPALTVPFLLLANTFGPGPLALRFSSTGQSRREAAKNSGDRRRPEGGNSHCGRHSSSGRNGSERKRKRELSPLRILVLLEGQLQLRYSAPGTRTFTPSRLLCLLFLLSLLLRLIPPIQYASAFGPGAHLYLRFSSTGVNSTGAAASAFFGACGHLS